MGALFSEKAHMGHQGEEDDSPTWLYACTYELALCLTSFAWTQSGGIWGMAPVFLEDYVNYSQHIPIVSGRLQPTLDKARIWHRERERALSIYILLLLLLLLPLLLLLLYIYTLNNLLINKSNNSSWRHVNQRQIHVIYVDRWVTWIIYIYIFIYMCVYICIYIYVYIYIYTQCNGESYVIEKQSILNYTYTHNHQESISFYSFLCVSSFFQETFGLGTHGLQRPPVPRQPLVPRDAAPADAPGAAEAVVAGIHGEGVLEPVFFRGNLSEILRETMENMGFSMNAWTLWKKTGKCRHWGAWAIENWKFMSYLMLFGCLQLTERVAVDIGGSHFKPVRCTACNVESFSDNSWGSILIFQGMLNCHSHHMPPSQTWEDRRIDVRLQACGASTNFLNNKSRGCLHLKQQIRWESFMFNRR